MIGSQSKLKKFLLLLCLISIHGYGQKSPGQTLYSIGNSTAAYLVDTNGTTSHTWTFASTSKTGYSTHMMPGGDIWRSIARTGNSFSGGGMCGEIQKVDYNGNVLWDFVYSSTSYCTHHDHCPLPNGNVLLIVYETKTASEVSAAGCTQSILMWSEKVIEVQPTGPTTGTIVWEWHIWDHLVQSVDSGKANYQTSIVDHPELLNINYATTKDWMHMNGIDYNPILDQIVVSSHYLNEWYVIDHSTTSSEAASHSGGLSGHGGDILFRWGNPAAYNATGTRILNVTHDSHWIKEGSPNAGYLVGYNNRGVSNSQSAVDQIEPPLVGYNYTRTPGNAYLPATYDIRHACNGYSSNMGGSQQLPNGNMLVCMATAGLIYEVNPAGTTLWSKTTTGSVAQSFRYDDCYINNTAPAIPEITESGDTLYATSATSYQWYLNGVQISTATDSYFVPDVDGVYLVRVTDVNGCLYSYSLSYRYVALQNKINNVSSNQLNISVYPNPSNGIVYLKNVQSLKNYSIYVFNTIGENILMVKNTDQIDLSNHPKGLYAVSIVIPGYPTLNKKISITQ